VDNVWESVKNVKNLDGNRHEITFAPHKTDKVRVVVNATRGANVKISEIEVYEK
jgi:hypothetical protein